VPKLRSTLGLPIFVFSGGAYWRFVGLEMTSAAGIGYVGGLASPEPRVTGVLAGDHIIFDRVLVHGGDSRQGKNNVDAGRGLVANRFTSFALIDSYVFDTMCVNACVDSQAISLGGNDPVVQEGPFKVVNNFLESAGETFMAGGGGTGSGCCTVPSDFEIRRNNSYKPAKIWQVSLPAVGGSTPNPDYYGTRVIVKNLGELKSGERVLLEGNLFENVWGGQSDQTGAAVLIIPRNQMRAPGGCANSDGNGNLTSAPCASGKGTPITFTQTATSPDCAVPNHCRVGLGQDLYHATSLAQAWISSTQLSVSPPLPAFTGQFIGQCEPGGNGSAGVLDITMRFNIVRHAARGILVSTQKSGCGDESMAVRRIHLHDNQLDDIDGWRWNTSDKACCGWGDALGIDNSNATPEKATGDVSISHNTILVRQSGTVAGLEGAIHLSNHCGSTCATLLDGISIRDNLGGGGLLDDQDKGDPCIFSSQARPATTLLECLGGTTRATGWCVTGNALSSRTLTGFPEPGINTPFPTSSPACPSDVSTFNFNPADYASFDFTNLNDADGGDYSLTSSSPFHAAGSDGKDIGANIASVNLYTQGVE
jgi:hypothetical protein